MANRMQDSTPRADAQPPSNAVPVEPKPPSMGPAPAKQTVTDPDPWPQDCEYRQVFRAHGKAAGGDTSKFEIAGGSEYTAGFYFRPEWDGGESVQMLKARELIDNRKVVHHWMLYTMERTTLDEGMVRGDPQSQTATGPGPSAQYLLGGVAGATVFELPPDVGLRLNSSPNLAFSLEIHYYNSGDAAEQDASGVEVCVTRKKRPLDAAAHWLGTVSFSVPPREKTDVTSTCRPQMTNGPAHVLAYTPHMHKAGVHSKAVIHRATGEDLMLHDAPYQFTEQRLYPQKPELLVNPGDSISLTCTFLNDTDRRLAYGESSDDEMCFLTLWAWPAGSIQNGSPLGALLSIPVDQACL